MITGLCDTYCVLQFEDDKRRVPFKAKTITIMNDSEPVFNQRFIVPLMDVRSDVLRIEIWDKVDGEGAPQVACE